MAIWPKHGETHVEGDDPIPGIDVGIYGPWTQPPLTDFGTPSSGFPLQWRREPGGIIRWRGGFYMSG